MRPADLLRARANDLTRARMKLLGMETRASCVRNQTQFSLLIP